MDAKKTAQQVLEQVGGAENVTFLTHCVTRLRFNLKSMDGVDEAKVKAVPGVMGVVNKGGQYQVIIGNEVAAVYDELMKLGDFGGKEVKQPAAPAEEKKSRVSIILDTLAGVFTPLMPLIAGAGMIKALLSVLTLFGWIDKSGNLYYFLNFIADSSYYFLPIFLANSAAKKFGCNPQMAMLLGAILLHPNFIALKADADVVHVLGLPVKMVTYSSSVIPLSRWYCHTWNDLSIRSCPLWSSSSCGRCSPSSSWLPSPCACLALWAASSAMVWSTSCWPLKRSAPGHCPPSSVPLCRSWS